MNDDLKDKTHTFDIDQGFADEAGLQAQDNPAFRVEYFNILFHKDGAPVDASCVGVMIARGCQRQGIAPRSLEAVPAPTPHARGLAAIGGAARASELDVPRVVAPRPAPILGCWWRGRSPVWRRGRSLRAADVDGKSSSQ